MYLWCKLGDFKEDKNSRVNLFCYYTIEASGWQYVLGEISESLKFHSFDFREQKLLCFDQKNSSPTLSLIPIFLDGLPKFLSYHWFRVLSW